MPVLAFCLGAGAVWGAGGRYDVLRGAATLVLSLGVYAAVARWLGADWATRAVPLYVVAGWFGGAIVWDWALVGVVLMAGLPAWWRSVGARVASEAAVLVVAIVAGVVPAWCLLALPALLLAWPGKIGPIYQIGQSHPSRAWRDWVVAFNLQVLIGFLIQGMVR